MSVEEIFAKQRLLVLMGAKLDRVADGEVDISLDFRDDLAQQSGALHAGTVATIADTACGLAALSLMPAGSGVVSVEFKLNLLAPAVGAHFVAKGRVVRAGKTLSVCTADVIADGERVVATMLATMMRRAPLSS
jgi:uncharacterized protein (TIGR00369 family)